MRTRQQYRFISIIVLRTVKKLDLTIPQIRHKTDAKWSGWGEWCSLSSLSHPKRRHLQCM